MNNQEFQDSFVTVVIDPNCTISAETRHRRFPYLSRLQVPIYFTLRGSVWTRSKAWVPNQYYQFEVEIFKSSVDDELLDVVEYVLGQYIQSEASHNHHLAAFQSLAELSKVSGILNTRATLPPRFDKEHCSKAIFTVRIRSPN
ncbi:hypothetical protein E1B28_007851 [Marasmius oreades]|uniref:Uncharacterized protein n=1 Tax=Marasmius oreades TaxID=181124 RepID=A0A9P7UVD8_9AGAR|nr:uncharacterized protein E1B28_007851 [Marasmius oreades]KAG7094246.1 hypothetical protein E1B28_007851 [Marasmius oreades]